MYLTSGWYYIVIYVTILFLAGYGLASVRRPRTDVTHDTGAHWRYTSKLRLLTKRRFYTSSTIMCALICQVILHKISIKKKRMSLFLPCRKGSLFLESRVMLNQDGQLHRWKDTSSVWFSGNERISQVLNCYNYRVEIKTEMLNTCYMYNFRNLKT